MTLQEFLSFFQDLPSDDQEKMVVVLDCFSRCLQFLRSNSHLDPQFNPPRLLNSELFNQMYDVCDLVANSNNRKAGIDEIKKVFYELIFHAHRAMKNTNDGANFATIKQYYRQSIGADLCDEVEKGWIHEDEFNRYSIGN